MKKIIIPAVKEHSVYSSDIAGKIFDYDPSINLTIECNYGSKQDGTTIELHFTEEEAKDIFSYIKSKILPETQKQNLQFWAQY